jgi:hypothetical protein
LLAVFIEEYFACLRSFSPLPCSPNHATTRALRPPSRQRCQFVPDKGRIELRRQLMPGKGAQEQRPRFAPGKERQGRLAAQVQPRTRHNENLIIPHRRAARPHLRFCHEASGGKCVQSVVLFDLEPGVIGSITLCRRSASSSAWETREPKRGRGQLLG